jgi:hypothetical protein
MKFLSVSCLSLAFLVCVSSPAFADVGFQNVTVGTELPGFGLGCGPCDPVGGQSQLDTGSYYSISALLNGWSALNLNTSVVAWEGSGGTYNGVVGILLNENASAVLYSPNIPLTVGKSYTLTFDYWGDNRPGETYVLDVSVNGASPQVYTSTDPGGGVTGTYNIGSITFTALASNAFSFSQNTPADSQASPIIGNVSVPESDLTLGFIMSVASLGMMVALARKNGWRAIFRAN